MFSSLHRKTTSATRPRSIHQGILAVSIAFLLIARFSAGPAEGQVSGNAYTSPQFNYTIGWDQSWFLIDEVSIPGWYDLLAITNGVTTVNLYGELNTYSNYESGLATYITGFNVDPGVSAFTAMKDDQGNVIREIDENGARAAFTFTYSFAEGPELPMAVFMEVYGLDSNALLFGYWAVTPLLRFDLQNSLAGVELPGEAPSASQSETEPDLSTIDAVPVFASDPWRIAVVSVAENKTFPDLGLKKKSDREWMVLIVDVTNWSDTKAVLSAKDFSVEIGPSEKPASIARKYVAPLAEHLGTTIPEDNLVVLFDANETIRIALPFVVPEESPFRTLTHTENSIQLDRYLKDDLDAGAFPALAAEPVVDRGTIRSVSDGQRILIQISTDEELVEVELIGIDLAGEESCHRNEAEEFLQELIGDTVLIEEDIEINRSWIPNRYVWLVNDDGTRTLLNQQLIAEGLTHAAALPADARFGEWFQTSAEAAEAAGIGVWNECFAPGSGDGVLMSLSNGH